MKNKAVHFHKSRSLGKHKIVNKRDGPYKVTVKVIEMSDQTMQWQATKLSLFFQ